MNAAEKIVEAWVPLLPFARWAGGKKRLAPRLAEEIMALRPKIYIEPFLGMGAIALALPPSLPKILSDINQHLIDAWLCIQKMPGSLFAELEAVELKYQVELNETALGQRDVMYKAARAEFNTMIHNPRRMWARRSALFLYLNARSFNGLWRTSRKSGEFNVPLGDNSPRKLSSDELAAYSNAVARCTLLSLDFGKLFEHPIIGVDDARGITIYADPPYDEAFEGYARSGFDDHDQYRLAEHLKQFAERGVAVFATNADTELVRHAYSWAQLERVEERHSVGAKGNRRGLKPCLLIRGGAACRS